MLFRPQSVYDTTKQFQELKERVQHHTFSHQPQMDMHPDNRSNSIVLIFNPIDNMLPQMFEYYRQTSNIRRTKSPNLKVSRLVPHLSLPGNPLKPGVKSRMTMSLEQRRQAMLQLHPSDQQLYCRRRCVFISNVWISYPNDGSVKRGVKSHNIQTLFIHWLYLICCLVVLNPMADFLACWWES